MSLLEFLNLPLTSKRRGGWRQRAATAASAKSSRIRSKLAERQLGKWCDGHSTTPNLVQVCRDGIEDGLTQPILYRLGCLVSKSSRFRVSMSKRTPRLREVMAVLQNESISKFIIAVPGSEIKCFLKPSMVMQYILSNYPHKFKVNFGANRARLAEFWEGLLSSPFGRELGSLNPMVSGKTLQELSNCIPICLHEDAGPYAKGHSMNIINFSSLLARGPQESTKFIIASHIKTAEEKPNSESLAKFWAEIIADFDELASSDKLIANDEAWRVILVFGKGDMEMRVQTWGLPGWGHKIDVCPNCMANRETRPYTDNRPSAAWRPTSLSSMPSSFFMDRLAEPRHPMTLSKYFHKWFAVLDVMHVMDCKGVTSHVAGGVLRYLIVHEMRLGRNQESRLANLNLSMAQFQDKQKTPSRMPEFRSDNFVSKDGWAQLSGQLIKAANTRHLVPWLVNVTEEYFDKPTKFDRAVVSLLQNLQVFYQVMYSADTFFTPEELTKFNSCVLKFGIRYQFLREHFKVNNDYFLNFVHKVHAMQHLPEIASVINPRMLQCYAEEGAVGRIGTIWKASKHGPYRKRVQEVVLTKLLIRMHLGLTGIL